MVRMSLSEKIKHMALEQGFVAAGITNPEKLKDLPYGWVADVRDLLPPTTELPETKSVIMLVLHAWDKVFGLQIESPDWKGYGFHPLDANIEGYYISYYISMSKAWPIVSYLREQGYKAQLTTKLPLKTAAIACGLGQSGKNTLLVNPGYGPRLGLMAILTQDIINQKCNAIYNYHLSLTNFLRNLASYMRSNLKGTPVSWSCPLMLLNTLSHLLVASQGCSHKKHRLT